MMMEEVVYLSEQDVELINHTVIEVFSPGEQRGIKDANLLQSALGRPKQTLFGKDAYQTIFEKAAALFESLALNHPFYNANKRTAFTALDHFLFYNGWDLDMDQQFAEDFTVDSVLKKYSFEEKVNIIKQYSRHIEQL
jgi:death-on-curing protein